MTPAQRESGQLLRAIEREDNLRAFINFFKQNFKKNDNDVQYIKYLSCVRRKINLEFTFIGLPMSWT